MINDRGGINGRKINFISLDAGSDAAKARSGATTGGTGWRSAHLQFHRDGKQPGDPPLHEREEGAAAFRRNQLRGIRRSLAFPLDHGIFRHLPDRGLAYAKYILQNKPGAKIAVLYANDDAGKEYLAGVRDGLGDKAAAMIVKEVSYRFPIRRSIRRSRR